MADAASVAERLAALGIALPRPATPLAIYRPALRSGRTLYISGQLPTRDGALLHPGHLGAGVSVEQGREAARAAALNALAAAQALLGDLERVRVLRLAGYVACTPEFTDQPAVINGASELLRDVLGEERGVGTRVAIGLAALPAGAAVEIDLTLELLDGDGPGGG